MLVIIICLFAMLGLGFIAGWEARDWDQEREESREWWKERE